RDLAVREEGLRVTRRPRPHLGAAVHRAEVEPRGADLSGCQRIGLLGLPRRREGVVPRAAKAAEAEAARRRERLPPRWPRAADCHPGLTRRVVGGASDIGSLGSAAAGISTNRRRGSWRTTRSHSSTTTW